jgi:xanthine dehydrogenase accessory factor
VTSHIAVTVVETRGSVPREAGAAMMVWADRTEGTIGGGALEWEAIRIAREMLHTGATRMRRTFPLGPDLGQCCGGAVTLEFIAGALGIEPYNTPLYIWGAGHVGRAILGVMTPFGDRIITLVDTSADRMPTDLAPVVRPLVAAEPTRAVPYADANADHLILTYSHDLDLALCDALLRHGFASCGLIGSRTKWARFRKRLAVLGHAEHEINRITCPIGDPSLGKHPQAIAVGVAAGLLRCDAQQEAKGTG